jgi:hypothetical protein
MNAFTFSRLGVGGTTALLLTSALLCTGCMDRNGDKIPDEAQPNVPGSAANRAKGALETTEHLAENAATTGRIKAALLSDKSVHATKINVDTVDGVVTLKGEVPTEAEKTRAEEVAAKTSGVASVHNELVISPSQAKETPGSSSSTPK